MAIGVVKQVMLGLDHQERKSALPLKTSNKAKLSENLTGNALTSIHPTVCRQWLQEIQAVNDGLNAMAFNVRVADVAMQQISDLIGMMKATLNAIMRNDTLLSYTPKRVGYLEMFSALRAEIDRWATPNEEGARKIMSAPSTEIDMGGWELSIGDQESRILLPSRQVHCGPTGLDLPLLDPVTATDKEISTALSRLDHAQETLTQRRQALASDAMNALQSIASVTGTSAVVSAQSADHAGMEVREALSHSSESLATTPLALSDL